MHLTVLETFDGYLSNEMQKSRIEKICEEIFINVTQGSAQFYVSFDNLNILPLDYEKKDLLYPPVIEDWHVPVPLANLDNFKTYSSDLIVLKVMNSIDGRKNIKYIKNEVNVSDNNIRLCLKHLFYQGLIEFIDLFHATNIYRITGKINSLLNDLASESVQWLCKLPELNEIDVFNYYCLLSDKTISDFLEENPEFILKFDIEMFIAYGLLKKVIRRVHKYWIENNSKRQVHKSSEKIERMIEKGMLKGNICMDEICTYFDVQQRTIESLLKDSCIFYHK